MCHSLTLLDELSSPAQSRKGCGMKGSLTEFRSVHTETSLRLKAQWGSFACGVISPLE